MATPLQLRGSSLIDEAIGLGCLSRQNGEAAASKERQNFGEAVDRAVVVSSLKKSLYRINVHTARTDRREDTSQPKQKQSLFLTALNDQGSSIKLMSIFLNVGIITLF